MACFGALACGFGALYRIGRSREAKKEGRSPKGAKKELKDRPKESGEELPKNGWQIMDTHPY